jgi:hypothetical protein
LTITETIENCHDATGRKLEGKEIDERGIVIACLQFLCREYRWPWRRKRGTFTSVAGTKTYDLSSSTYGDAVDLEELIAMYYIVGAEVKEAKTSTATDDMVCDLISTASGDPGRFTQEPGTDATVRFDKCSNARTFYFYYWAIPNPGIDSTSDTIPLLPSMYHYVLQQFVTAVFWSLLPGEGVSGPNASAAFQMYRLQVELMKSKGTFSTQDIKFFKSKEKAVSSA